MLILQYSFYIRSKAALTISLKVLKIVATISFEIGVLSVDRVSCL
jgi:hypothetical protein